MSEKTCFPWSDISGLRIQRSNHTIAFCKSIGSAFFTPFNPKADRTPSRFVQRVTRKSPKAFSTSVSWAVIFPTASEQMKLI